MKKNIMVTIDFTPNKYGCKVEYYKKGFRNEFSAMVWAMFQIKGREAAVNLYNLHY